MVLAVAKALEAGAAGLICASTGNTSASAAAYAAAAGLDVRRRAARRARSRPASCSRRWSPGRAWSRSTATSTRHLRSCGDLAADHARVTLVNSVNPFRIEGQKTAAFEVCDDLGRAPDVLAIPVGNAGNITAYWAGFGAYRAAGVIDALPRMLGFQAAGAAPIVLGRVVERPETVATAIRIGNPASWARRSRGARRIGRGDRGGVGRGDPRGLPGRRAARGRVLRAVVGGLDGGRAPRCAAEAASARTKSSCACSPGNGLKDPDTALRGLARRARGGPDRRRS